MSASLLSLSAGRSRRQILAGTAAAAGLPVLARCGVGADESNASFRGDGPTVKITYLQRPKAPDRQAILEGLLAQFSAQVPRVQVEVASDPDIVQKALAVHVAGTTAEIVEWARDGYDLRDSIVDLKPLMARDKIGEDVFIPTVAEILSRDGKFMGIPYSVSADGLVYNPNAFREAGLAAPPTNPADRSWTMERFQDNAIRLTRRPDRFGWAGSISGGFNWMDAATYFGVGVWDDKAQKLLINTAEFRRGLQYWVDLRLRHRVVADTEEARNIPNGFASGQIATNVAFSLPANPQFQPAVAALPYGGPGRNVSARISPGVMFAGRTKQVDAAWQLLKWIVEPAHDAAMAKAAGHVVTGIRKAAETRRKEFQTETGVDAEAWIQQAAHSKFVGWGLYKYPQAEIVSRGQVDVRFRNELLAGTISVAEFCAFAEQQLNGAIAAGR